MPKLDLHPDAIAREVEGLHARLSAGLTTLHKLKDVAAGATPRDAIFSKERMVLYRYRNPSRAPDFTPVLIVYALVNRPEMADLQEGRSLIAALIKRGFDVYLIDWGYPDGSDRMLGLDDYINRYIDAAVDHVRKSLGRERLPLFGICQGGTFSTCYAALHPHKVERLITTVTPIDFHTPDDMLSHLVRGIDVDALIDSSGNISGDFLNGLFLSLKPYRLMQQKYIHFLEHIDDEEAAALFLRMERWIFDSPALTATVCREFAKDFYQGNKLVLGGLAIGGRRVDLRQITMPVLNIYARNDHLVPPPSSRALKALVGTPDYSEAELPGGHIGLYVSLKSPRSVPTLLADWMQKPMARSGRRR